MSDDPPRERVRVRYKGRVQGVGFRATAARLAMAFPVDGWVRNLWDGDVDLVAEGNPEAVEQFLARVRTAFERKIVSVEIAPESPGLAPGSGFRVRYD